VLDIGQCESSTHHLGDANVHNMQSVEFAASKQFTSAVGEVHICKDELTDKSPGDLLHDAVVPHNVVKQEGSPISDLSDADVHHLPRASYIDSVIEDHLGPPNVLAELTGPESFSETSQDRATHDSIHTEKINMAPKQCTDLSDMSQLNTYETFIVVDTDHSVVSVGLSEIQSIDHNGTLHNDGQDLASGCSKSDHESMIVHDSCYSDVSEYESCHKDAHSSNVRGSYSGDIDTRASEISDIDLVQHASARSLTYNTECTGSRMTNDREVYDMASSLDCENSRFADILIDNRSQRAKLMLLDCSEMEASHSKEDVEPVTQNQLCSLLSCILDKTENLGDGFQSAMDFQQDSDCLSACIYASFGGMEILDDMELIPVQDGKTLRDNNVEGTKAISSMNSYLDSMKNIAGLNCDDDCVAAGICASLGGMELCDDVEFIPVGDEETDGMLIMKDTESNCNVKNFSENTMTVADVSSDIDTIDQQTYDNDNAQHEFSQVNTDISEVYRSASISDNKEHVETMSASDCDLEDVQCSDDAVGTCNVLDRDDSHGILPQMSNSGARLLLTVEHPPTSDHILRRTNATHESNDHEMPQSHMLLHTDEVYNSDNEYSEPTAAVDEIGSTSSVVLASATSSAKSVADTENVDALISLETTDIDSTGTLLTVVTDSAVSGSPLQVENSYLSSSKTPEGVENRENENSEVLIQVSDSGIRSLLTPEHVPVSDQMLHFTDTAQDSGGQEMPPCHLLLRLTDEICGSNNEPMDTADEDGRMSVVLKSTTSNLQPVEETENVYTLISLETSDLDSAGAVLTEVDSAIFNNAPEVEQHYLSSSESLEEFKNAENNNSTNTDCGITGHAAHATSADPTDAGLSETSIMEHQPDLLLLNDEDLSSTVYHADEDVHFSVFGSGQQLEPFTVDSASLHTQRLELDDLTLTVTCFIPEESEELLPDGDVLEHFGETNQMDVPLPPYSTKLTGSDPVTSFDLPHYMDHNTVTADRILSKHRSSEFVQSHLMPIDETAEFTDDASIDSDLVPDKSHLLQPADELDMKTESGDNDELKVACSTNASSTTEHIQHLCHELSGRVQQDDVAANSGIENPALDSSASDDCGFGMTVATNSGCKLNSSDSNGPIIFSESHSAVEQFDGHVTIPFSAYLQDIGSQVACIDKYKSEGSADVVASSSEPATNGTQVDYLFDDGDEQAMRVEHSTLTANLPRHASSKDHISNSDVSVLLAASATQNSPSMYSVVKTAAFDSVYGHSPDTNAFKQNNLEGVNNVTDCDNDGKNAENNNIIDLDMKISPGDVTILDENSITTSTAVLKCLNEPCKQRAQTTVELCERPVLQSSNMQSVLDAILQDLVHSYQAVGNTEHSIVEELPTSHMASKDKDTPQNTSPALSCSSPVVVFTPAMEVTEEPAVDAVTDFESILEQLHCTEHSA